MNIWTEAFCQMTGYEIVTDYWKKFEEKEKEGLEQIKSYIKEEFKNLKSLDLTKKENYKKLTEFVMMLNWRSWWLDDNDMQGELEDAYIKAWEFCHNWCYDNFNEEAKKYYFRTTD